MPEVSGVIRSFRPVGMAADEVVTLPGQRYRRRLFLVQAFAEFRVRDAELFLLRQ